MSGSASTCGIQTQISWDQHGHEYMLWLRHIAACGTLSMWDITHVHAYVQQAHSQSHFDILGTVSQLPQ